MSKRSPAVGELLSSIAVIGATAVAAAILFAIFSEQNQDGIDVIETRGEVSMARASELVDTSHASCTEDGLVFLLHNYSDDTVLDTDSFRAYVEDGLAGAEIEWLALDMETPAVDVPPSTTVLVRHPGHPCGDELILQSPTGELIRVGVP